MKAMVKFHTLVLVLCFYPLVPRVTNASSLKSKLKKIEKIITNTTESDVQNQTTTAPKLWDKKKAILDVAYFLRVHKFVDYDRRYYKNVNDTGKRLYEEFPRPRLRALHWEVRKACDINFSECLKYLESIIKLTALRREDDTITIINEQKWDKRNNSEEIKHAQEQCKLLQKQDHTLAAPFQGPIERFQWRTTASYYMCWYTMLNEEDLKHFGEPCDNFANCLDSYGMHNKDPRATDTNVFACAVYSFCPDHCCPMKHIKTMEECWSTSNNPCFENDPADRQCTFRYSENRDFERLIMNEVNVSCLCKYKGYEYSPRYGLCVDVNECVTGEHNCSAKLGLSCINLPGRFACICNFKYSYNGNKSRCDYDPTLEDLLELSNKKPKKSLENIFAPIIKFFKKSSGNCLCTDRSFAVILLLLKFII